MQGGESRPERKNGMINAYNYIKVEFDENGERRIREAIDTLNEIIGSISKITLLEYVDDMRTTVEQLEGFLKGEMI